MLLYWGKKKKFDLRYICISNYANCILFCLPFHHDELNPVWRTVNVASFSNTLRNKLFLSRCVYSDILYRNFPQKKTVSPCAECVTFSLPRIKFKLSSGYKIAAGEDLLLLLGQNSRNRTYMKIKYIFLFFTKIFHFVRHLSSSFWQFKDNVK